MTDEPKICVVTDPRPIASVIPLCNLTSILARFSNYLFLITGNEGERVLQAQPGIKGYSIKYKPNNFVLLRMIRHIFLQLQVCCEIIRINHEINIYIFMFGENLVLPVLTCKLFRKPVILYLAGSEIKIAEQNKSWAAGIFISMQKMNYRLANIIVVYSQRLISEWNLVKFAGKIVIAHEHIIDFKEFQTKKSHRNRTYQVGYIGRLSEEKGILSLVEAIPAVLGVNKNINFFIGGDGQLMESVKKYINDNSLQKKVTLGGWINHNDLPSCLNDIQLLVIPSFTEGLPNIMLEAMVCGTAVLASSVGAIPDIIRNEETGFILKDNSSNAIAGNILKALSNPYLEQIAIKGSLFIKSEFEIQKTIDRFKKVIEHVMRQK
jgi:glycosyltransferase involved in cell wall biosynthesis